MKYAISRSTFLNMLISLIQTNIENVLPSEDHNDCSTEPLFTMDSDNQSAATSTLATANIADCQSQAPTFYTTQEHNSDPPSNHDNVPRTRLRARNVKKVTCATVPTQKQRHEKSVLQHDVVTDRPRTGRPVIFAGPLIQSKKKASTPSSGVNYSIEDLINGCHVDSPTISPSVRTLRLFVYSNIMLPHRYTSFSLIRGEMTSSKITPHHNTTHC
jgi:hypothetical protein